MLRDFLYLLAVRHLAYAHFRRDPFCVLTRNRNLFAMEWPTVQCKRCWIEGLLAK